ncbi:MAG: hypothetical protein J6M14_00400 [Campylobacter sp.]|nr:hypothetical protein [Campylobacter sp.]
MKFEFYAKFSVEFYKFIIAKAIFWLLYIFLSLIFAIFLHLNFLAIIIVKPQKMGVEMFLVILFSIILFLLIKKYGSLVFVLFLALFGGEYDMDFNPTMR